MQYLKESSCFALEAPENFGVFYSGQITYQISYVSPPDPEFYKCLQHSFSMSVSTTSHTGYEPHANTESTAFGVSFHKSSEQNVMKKLTHPQMLEDKNFVELRGDFSEDEVIKALDDGWTVAVVRGQKSIYRLPIKFPHNQELDFNRLSKDQNIRQVIYMPIFVPKKDLE